MVVLKPGTRLGGSSPGLSLFTKQGYYESAEFIILCTKRPNLKRTINPTYAPLFIGIQICKPMKTAELSSVSIHRIT